MALAVRREADASDAAVRRAAAAFAATREVMASANATEADAVVVLLKRLQQLKRELQGIIASAASSQYRRFTASTLIAHVDALIADATRDLQHQTRPLLTTAARLGATSVDDAIDAARLAVAHGPGVDGALVTRAYDATADLLTEPMQQFRGQIVRGVRRAALMGDSAHEHLQALAQDIDAAGFDSAAYKAERIVRTEMSRVLNETAFERMTTMADRMPFVRKGWSSARDSRTRRGHAAANDEYSRGNGIPVDERFKVRVYADFPGKGGHGIKFGRLLGIASLRFPADPAAEPAGRVAAGATIMCRCHAFVDFDVSELQDWSTSRSRAVSVPAAGGAGRFV